MKSQQSAVSDEAAMGENPERGGDPFESAK
jgi:hypothetical protein